VLSVRWGWPRHIVKADNQIGAAPAAGMMPIYLRERDLAREGETTGGASAGKILVRSASRGTEQVQAGHDRHAEPAGPDDVDGWAGGRR